MMQLGGQSLSGWHDPGKRTDGFSYSQNLHLFINRRSYSRVKTVRAIQLDLRCPFMIHKGLVL